MNITVSIVFKKVYSHTVICKLCLFIILLLLSTCTSGKSSISTEIPAKMSIDKSVDPNYVYEYSQSKYVPSKDKTLLIVGQSLKNINDYRAVSQYKNYPGGWSAYWAVTEFDGFTRPWTTISGDTQYHGFLADKFDNMVLHSAMWMVGKWEVAKKVINGSYDFVIKQYCDWAKTIKKPIY